MKRYVRIILAARAVSRPAISGENQLFGYLKHSLLVNKTFRRWIFHVSWFNISFFRDKDVIEQGNVPSPVILLYFYYHFGIFSLLSGRMDRQTGWKGLSRAPGVYSYDTAVLLSSSSVHRHRRDTRWPRTSVERKGKCSLTVRKKREIDAQMGDRCPIKRNICFSMSLMSWHFPSPVNDSIHFSRPSKKRRCRLPVSHSRDLSRLRFLNRLGRSIYARF